MKVKRKNHSPGDRSLPKIRKGLGVIHIGCDAGRRDRRARGGAEHNRRQQAPGPVAFGGPLHRDRAQRPRHVPAVGQQRRRGARRQQPRHGAAEQRRVVRPETAQRHAGPAAVERAQC